MDVGTGTDGLERMTTFSCYFVVPHQNLDQSQDRSATVAGALADLRARLKMDDMDGRLLSPDGTLQLGKHKKRPGGGVPFVAVEGPPSCERQS